MPNNSPFVASVNELLAKLEDNPTINTGIELANQIVSRFGDVHTKSVEDVFESSIELPNAERYDSWFQPHPIFKSDRACFNLADSPLLQAKFYWLKKRSRQIIAGGVHFTPNYEDEEFTHNERYKVGLDFFLSPNGKSLQVVLSNRGNLRIVELAGRLNNTQKEIFEKWVGAGSLPTQKALHTTLWESFKLKSVNQKFYDGVSNSFTELLQHLKSIDKDEEEAKLFASRLLGRLLFCWFLRKKGIIDESIGYFNAQGVDATTYYKQLLERLFFLTLNTPIDERDELTKQHQKSLFPELLVDDQPSLFRTDQKTPYLNGGLFEPHENDWYKDDSLTLPVGFFTNLYDHFEEFNFTTDESSPEYEQIAIDPEMLGRVFESLLATQVDETGQQARKAKGTFYTPREIVSFMCKESLRSYLYGATNSNENIKYSIDSLLDITDSEWAKSRSNTLRDKVKDNRTQIIDALDAVTILDPACGSGAFPMGMLQLILKTYERLENRFDPYKTKLSIIQNNIFGVDIEPMAVEISRLRAWLSLIVDEDNPRSLDPLPNLDFKFVCADSLTPLKASKQVDWLNSANSDLHRRLTEVRKEYFNARKPHTKKIARDKYYKLTSAPQGLFDDTRTRQLKSFDPFRNSTPALFFDGDQMFGINSGFDVIIGNPPYGAKIDSSSRHSIIESLSTVEGPINTNSAGLFIDSSISLRLKNGGTLAFIVPKSLLYSESWHCNVERIIDRVTILVDVEKAFDDVKLEQVVFIYDGKTTAKYRALKFKNEDYLSDIEINKNTFSMFRAWICDVTAEEIDIAEKLISNGKMAEISDTKRGLGVQKLLKTEGDVKLIGGKNISRFAIKGAKGFLDEGSLSRDSTKMRFFTQPKVVSQDLVAHIQNPKPLIKITSAVDLDGAVVGLDTVQNTVIKDSRYSLQFIAAILNSKLINWYVYRFIYCSAIRTMHFDNYYIGKIPIPKPNSEQIDSITTLVDHVHNADDLAMVDQAVYDVYGLSKQDIETIERIVGE